jgi:hypothetical protein
VTDDSMMSILEFLPPSARMQLTRERLDLLGEIARLREALDVARSDLLTKSAEPPASAPPAAATATPEVEKLTKELARCLSAARAMSPTSSRKSTNCATTT